MRQSDLQVWKVQCDCGNKAEVFECDLASGAITSCGQCDKADMTSGKYLPAGAPLEPTLDESVWALSGGAYTAKSSQESHYGKAT